VCNVQAVEVAVIVCWDCRDVCCVLLLAAL
jgi:hypothetical protein